MSRRSRPTGFPKRLWDIVCEAGAQDEARRTWGAGDGPDHGTALAITAAALGVAAETVQARLDDEREARRARRRQHEANRIVVNCDGLCKPVNPGGTATFGWVARRNGQLLASDCGVVARGRQATSNFAEYRAVIEALRWLEKTGCTDEAIVLRSDSQIVVYQVTGTYAVRSPAIWPLWSEASELARRFSQLSFEWVRRTQNKEADALTRKAYAADVAAGRPDLWLAEAAS